MLKSSLLEIIRTFTPKEIIKFEDFVKSPYFNKNKNVINLFREIKKYAPEFKNENLSKETVWKKLFPEKDYNYGIMKNIIHDLNLQCELFMSVEIYRNDDHIKETDLLRSFIDRDLNKLFEYKYEMINKSFKKDFKNKKFDSASDYFNKMNIITGLNERFMHNDKPQLKNKIDVKPECEYLVYEFFIRSFKLYQKVIGHSLQYNYPLIENILHNFLKASDENGTIEKILDHCRKTSPDYFIILNCYYSLFKAFIYNDSFDNCKDLKNNISINSDKLPLDDLTELSYGNMTCLTNLKITLQNFSREYFDILMNIYNNRLFIHSDGGISPHFYSNMVNMSCSVKELEFAERFILEFSPKLPADFRESEYNYAMAILNFSKRNFNVSLEYISKISSLGKSEKYHIKNFQLQIYYELNDREAFEYAYDSLKHFLGKNKLINESRILVLTKECVYIRRLFKLKDKFDSYEFDSLKKEIELNKAGSKSWLLRKLDEVKSEHGKI